MARPSQHIVTVHGIRTFGEWQDRLAKLMASEAPSITVSRYRYGYFDLLQYLMPPLRRPEVSRFKEELQRLRRTQAAGESIAIVAHSFGTYIVAHSVLELAPSQLPSIDTIVLAGSVLPVDFPWSGILAAGKCQRVINDCGATDLPLAVGGVLALGSGMGGLFGFRGLSGNGVYNRGFEGGHDLFFRSANGAHDEFMRTHWLPLLASAEDASDVPFPPRSGVVGALALLAYRLAPWKAVVYGTLLAALAIALLWVQGLYRQSLRLVETQAFYVEALEQQNSLAGLWPHSDLSAGYVRVHFQFDQAGLTRAARDVLAPIVTCAEADTTIQVFVYAGSRPVIGENDSSDVVAAVEMRQYFAAQKRAEVTLAHLTKRGVLSKQVHRGPILFPDPSLLQDKRLQSSLDDVLVLLTRNPITNHAFKRNTAARHPMLAFGVDCSDATHERP